MPSIRISESLKAIVETKGAVTSIDEFLTKTLAGKGGSEDFRELMSTLQRMEGILLP